MSQEELPPAWVVPSQQQVPYSNPHVQQGYNTQYYGQQPQPSQYSQTIPYTAQGSHTNQSPFVSQGYQTPLAVTQFNQQVPQYSPYPSMTQSPVPVGNGQFTYTSPAVQSAPTLSANTTNASSTYPPNQYLSQSIHMPQVATPIDKPVFTRSLSASAVPTPDEINKRNLSALTIKSQDVEYEDGRVYNTEAMSKIRDAWMYKQLRTRASEFTQYKQVRPRR